MVQKALPSLPYQGGVLYGVPKGQNSLGSPIGSSTNIGNMQHMYKRWQPQITDKGNGNILDITSKVGDSTPKRNGMGLSVNVMINLMSN